MVRHCILWVAASLCVSAAYAAEITATASAQVVERLEIINKEPLNFGHLTPVGAGGSVTLTIGGVRQVTGGVQPSGSYHRARFEVRGTPSKNYAIHTPSSQQFVTALAEEGKVNSLTVHDFTTRQPGMAGWAQAVS